MVLEEEGETGGGNDHLEQNPGGKERNTGASKRKRKSGGDEGACGGGKELGFSSKISQKEGEKKAP